jgi:hypothetical protein
MDITDELRQKITRHALTRYIPKRCGPFRLQGITYRLIDKTRTFTNSDGALDRAGCVYVEVLDETTRQWQRIDKWVE